MEENAKKAADLLRQAANYLRPPTTATPPLHGSEPGTSVQQQVRAIFAPYRGRGGGRGLPSMRSRQWSHRFFVLGTADQECVPDRVQREMLFAAGLGERKIAFTKDNSSATFTKRLEEMFPKLEGCGGYELLRTSSTSRLCLAPIRVPPGGYTAVFLSERLGQAVCYVRPIQMDLCLDPVVNDDDLFPGEKCINCGKDVPLNLLRSHIQSCGPEKRKESVGEEDDDDYLHPRKQLCTSEKEDNRKRDLKEQKPEQTQPCPVCNETFPAAVIEQHASACGEGDVQEIKTNCEKESKSLEASLEGIRGDMKGKWHVSVVRTRVIETAMQCMEDADEDDWQNEITVRFIGEEGVDGGGLRRELFSLIFANTPLLEDCTFANDGTALQKGQYMLLGRMVALAYIFGHTGVNILHPAIISYILREQVPQTEINSSDIKDASITDAIELVNKVTAENGVATAIEVGEILERAGFTKTLTVETKCSAIFIMKEYYIFYRCFGHIHQFIEGLKLHGVLTLMRENQADAAKFLGGPVSLSAETVANFFMSSFSDKSSPNRVKEEEIEYNFRRFLNIVEKGRVSSTVLNSNMQEVNAQVSLAKVMQALVGCPGIPRDISTGVIEYNHESTALSTVNTCAPSLCFQNTSKLVNYETFQAAMLDIVFGCDGFGQE